MKVEQKVNIIKLSCVLSFLRSWIHSYVLVGKDNGVN